jgi:hypothetical protein
MSFSGQKDFRMIPLSRMSAADLACAAMGAGCWCVRAGLRLVSAVVDGWEVAPGDQEPARRGRIACRRDHVMQGVGRAIRVHLLMQNCILALLLVSAIAFGSEPRVDFARHR